MEASHLPFAHWSEINVSTRDRLHNSSFFFKSTHPLSHWLCIVHQQWWEDMKNKLIPTQQPHHHQHRHQLCLQTGTLHHFAKCQGSYTICWDNWGRKPTNQTASGRSGWVQLCLILNIASKCKQGEECFEVIKESEYDSNRPHKSASCCFLCKRIIWTGDKSFQRVGVSGGMIKEVCVRWY